MTLEELGEEEAAHHCQQHYHWDYDVLATPEMIERESSEVTDSDSLENDLTVHMTMNLVEDLEMVVWTVIGV